MSGNIRLMKVEGKRKVHMRVDLPDIVVPGFVNSMGREGPTCGADFGMFYLPEDFRGGVGDITCRKCREMAEKNPSIKREWVGEVVF